MQKKTSANNPELLDYQTKAYYDNLISYIRSRLNNIGTSAYLLRTNLSSNEFHNLKYFNKINEEIESIRKLINNM